MIFISSVIGYKLQVAAQQDRNVVRHDNVNSDCLSGSSPLPSVEVSSPVAAHV